MEHISQVEFAEVVHWDVQNVRVAQVAKLAFKDLPFQVPIYAT